ncbi:MAG TPA: hypothetical protein PLW99_00690 [Candidatus Paceibacterota bacterium]|nr:MAG: hypothetical protein B7X03_01490 [Parcubacteria group bacterium 21-58-10]OYV83291.1 MAG: hypothetical protein B7W96_00005 [Parcubacteria group bacterium 37-58-5]HQT82650.1 hypothetical protein [Candidatus Paceibacterota bacterium]
MDTYEIRFPITNQKPYDQVCTLQNQVAHFTAVNPPNFDTPPFVTYIRQIRGVDDVVAEKLIKSVATRMRRAPIALHGVLPSKEPNVVILPALATQGVASLLNGIAEIFSFLPHQGGDTAADNMLYVPLTAELSSVSDRTRSLIRGILVPLIIAPLTIIELYRKPVAGGKYKKIASFPLLE